MPPRVTILTPTHDRAHTLPRVFASIAEQTFRNFEWLIIDDGSTDNTVEVITQCANQANFPVRYERQPNRGKHTALNAGFRLARGEYTAVIDSDDWYLPHALATLVAAWDGLPNRDEYVEVQGLCEDQHGELIGTEFPDDVFDTDGFAITFEHHVTGDKIGMQRTDIVRQYPFPDGFEGIYVTEAIVWHRIARSYRLRCLNRVLAGKEYRPEGITRTTPQLSTQMAGPRRIYFKEVLGMGRKLPARVTARMYANWIRNAVHAGVPLRAEIRNAPSKVIFTGMVPIGVALALRDRSRVR
jgi:glycosyltransferase involved in cell wall biosynthesis